MSVVANLEIVLENIRRSCERCGRDPREVTLVAVSKTVDKERIRLLHAAGQKEFGESRLQEALPKINHLPNDILWHYIGRLQKNKVRKVVADFRCIHSVDSLKIAQYMNQIAGESGLRPQVLLQINLAEEQTKGGFGILEAESCLLEVLALQNLSVCGLMCIPPYAEDREQSRVYFRSLRELRDRWENVSGRSLPHLSMGMSHDYAVAVEEGATLVRVGSSLFGERYYPQAAEDGREKSV